MPCIKTDGLKCLDSYEAAKAHHDSIKPLPERWGYKTRPAGMRKKRHMSIHMKGDDVCVRLYSTDVLRYRPNGELVIDFYPSLSTDQFLNAVAPHGIYARCQLSIGYVVGVEPDTLALGQKAYCWDGDYYCAEGSKMTLKRNEKGRWRPLDAGTFDRYTFDRREANKALKATRYAEFRTWLVAARALNTKHEWGRGWLRPEEALELLSAGKWLDMVRSANYGWTNAVDKLRMDIYRASNVAITKEPVDVVHGMHALMSIQRSYSKYGHGF